MGKSFSASVCVCGGECCKTLIPLKKDDSEPLKHTQIPSERVYHSLIRLLNIQAERRKLMYIIFNKSTERLLKKGHPLKITFNTRVGEKVVCFCFDVRDSGITRANKR